MPRYVVLADESQVWIDGSSSVHPVRATAIGEAARAYVVEHASWSRAAALCEQVYWRLCEHR
mgnify:CR=1 FL=1